MIKIKPSRNKEHWPRIACKAIATRERDLVIRIADWTKDRDEPAYDVEVYVGGVYDFNLSHSCTFHEYGSKIAARAAAVNFASNTISKLL